MISSGIASNKSMSCHAGGPKWTRGEADGLSLLTVRQAADGSP
jgi:hypothetical protein